MIFRIKKQLPTATPVDNVFIRDYLPEAPELAVKVYLYGLMLAGTGDESVDIASALGAEEADVRAAFFYLQGLNLVEIISEEPLQVLFLPADGAFRPDAVSGRYAELVESLKTVLGTRTLTGAELSKIYDWIDVFGFSQDAAVLIVSHCLDKKGARTSFAYMDKVAKALAGKGAFSVKAVRESFEDEELGRSGAAAIYRRWNRRGNPIEDEIALYEKWTKEWGVDEQALDYALSRMTSAESKTFAYLDKVIEELYKNGNISGERIAELSKQEDMITELARQSVKRAGLSRSPTAAQKEFFRLWSIEQHMSAELIFFAADCAKNASRPFDEMKRLLADWHDAGISSVNAAKERYESINTLPARREKKNRSLKYDQGEIYTKERLKELGISFGEEFYGEENK